MRIWGFRKRYILLCTIFFLFMAIHIYSINLKILHARLHIVASCIFLYSQLNEGEFPPSEKSLFESGLIKEDIENPGKYNLRYQLNYWQFGLETSSKELRWSRPIQLEKYKIKYGIDIESIKEKDGQLYDEEGVRFYFIKAPGFFLYRRLYNSVSLDIYREMKKLQDVG